MPEKIIIGKVISTTLKKEGHYLVEPYKRQAFDGQPYTKRIIVRECPTWLQLGDRALFTVSDHKPDKNWDIGYFYDRTRQGSFVLVHSVPTANGRFFGAAGFGRLFDRVDQVFDQNNTSDINCCSDVKNLSFNLGAGRPVEVRYIHGHQDERALLEQDLERLATEFPIPPEPTITTPEFVYHRRLETKPEKDKFKDFEPVWHNNQRFAFHFATKLKGMLLR